MTIITDYSLPMVSMKDEEITVEKDMEDIKIGAYLLSHLKPVCENCGCDATPQWRKGWYNELIGRSVLLCNKCGLKYHKSQYCPYCRFIYGKETEKSPQVWSTCSSCGRWVHVACESQHGGFSTPMGAYNCPDCRQRHSEKFSSRSHSRL